MLRNKIELLLILCVLVVTSQASEFNLMPITLNVEAGHAITADINHDGLPDIVMLSCDNCGVPEFVTLFGEPGGGFKKPIATVAAALGTFAVFTAGDVNGDGNLDLVALTSKGHPYVFLGNGSGHFLRTPALPYSSVGVACVLGDFNGDGKLDLAGAWYASNGAHQGVKLSILLGNGDGTFQAPLRTTLSTLTAVPSLVAADFNGDGKLDLVVTLGSSLAVLLGNGDGTFQQTNMAVTGNPYDVIAGDVNNDGRLDLVEADFEVPQVYVQLGNGDGTFQTQTSYPILEGDNTIALGDFNGDGYLDLAVNNTIDTETVYLNNGDGTFGSRTDYTVVSNGFLKRQVVADFNGDGLLDIAVPNQEGQNAGMIGLLLNTGTGTLRKK